MIQAKVEGQEIVTAPQEEPATQIIDLMSALKASLEEDDTRKPAAKAGKKAVAGAKKAAEG